MPKQLNSLKKAKPKSKITESFTLILLSLAVQTLIFIAVCIISLILNVKNNNYFLVAVVSLCVGNILSGFIAVRKTKKNGLINGVVYSLPSSLLYLLISFMLNSFKIDYLTAISVVLFVVSSAAGGVLSVNFRPKARIKSKR